MLTALRQWLQAASRYAGAVRQLVGLAWHAQPASFSGLLVLNVTQGLVPVATAWVTKLLFDLLAQALQGNTPSNVVASVLPLLVAQALLAALSATMTAGSTFLTAELSRRVTLRAQLAVYRQVNAFIGLRYFEDPRFYDRIQLATQGAMMGPQQTVHIFSSVLQSTVTLSGFLVVLLAFSPLLAALCAVAAAVQLVAELKLGRYRLLLAEWNSPQERQASYYGSILSGLPFVKELRLFGLADYFLDRFRRGYQAIHRAQRQQQARELRWQAGLGLLSSLVASAAFVVVVLQAFAGRISLGDVTLYTSAVGSVQGGLTGLVFAIASLNESLLFFRRFTDLAALPEPMPVASPGRPIGPLTAGIELRDVSFRYSAQHPWVLRHVNLTIPANRCMALVGSNGAGKTTLVKLLTRLYDPTEGHILWDGTDLRDFAPAALRARIGAIFQDYAQYGLTARENVGIGDVRRLDDLDRVRQAAMSAGIHEALAALPQGYETLLSRWLLGEGVGADLSGGEWQKIALARVFMRHHADFLVLDEPTAALDAAAEYETYRSFAELMTGRTTLLISHRFSTVRMADVIAVLEGGRIIEYGAHSELYARGGTYAKLYAMQADRYT